MNNQEFFELYKGCKCKDGSVEGILCGYSNSSIIMRTLNGWYEGALDNNAYIENKQIGDRYWNVERSMVDKSSKPNDEALLNKPIKTNDAEIYIKEHFPDLSEDDTDIYINIFTAGVNSIKP